MGTMDKPSLKVEEALGYGAIVVTALALLCAGILWMQSRDTMRGAVADDADLAYWASIRESHRPSDYEAYLDAFPEGRFAALAELRIKRHREVVDRRILEDLAETKLDQVKNPAIYDEIEVHPNLAILRARH
jgi:hypothetical protein